MEEGDGKEVADRRPPKSILFWGCLLLAVLGIAIGLGVGLGREGGGNDSNQISAINFADNSVSTNSPSVTREVDSPTGFPTQISPEPTANVTSAPSELPTTSPTSTPTIEPTASPTNTPTAILSTAAPVPAQVPIPLPITSAPVPQPESATNALVAPPTNAPAVPPTMAPVSPLTDAPVVPPTMPPVSPPTNAPVIPPTALSVAPLLQSSSPTSENIFPYYSSGNGMDCQCRWYRQEFIVSENSDWKTLNQEQLRSIAEVLRMIQDISNPYPIGDRRGLRGRNLQSLPGNLDGDGSTVVGETYAYGFSFRVTSQGRLGIPGHGDFGAYMEYAYAFCNSFAAILLPDYHEAFVETASQPSQLQQFADAAAIPSLVRVTPPEELDRPCQG